MKCEAEKDVPYTNMKTGHMFWKREPCGSDRMPGSKFCMWHNKPDYMPPENIEQILRAAGKLNK